MPNKSFLCRAVISIAFLVVILATGFSTAGPFPISTDIGSSTNPIPPTQPPSDFTFHECVSHFTVNTSNVIGAGGHFPELGGLPSEDKDLWPPSGHAERACWVEAAKTIDSSSLGTSINPSAMLPAVIFQVELSDPLLADGQFVWGPNVGDFDIRSYLQSKASPLGPYSDDIEIWARYTTVNPKVLLTVLELQHGYVNALSADLPPETIRETVEKTSMALATAFYEHLHTWGTRKSPQDQTDSNPNPVVIFADGSAAQLDPDDSSGTFAIAATLAESTDMAIWQKQISTQDPDGFTKIFDSLFPETDRLDNSNNINPPDLPAADLFQFPFPLGATWRFAGPHSWAGDDTLPFSSLDFSAGSGTCDSPPNLYTVAAASGPAIRPYGYDCWLEIDHAGGWTTSYYHLQNLIDPQGNTVNQNGSLGTIACELCAGGWASGPHVHWSLKFNGAYVSLEGVKITGWTIHVGPEPYDTGYIERDSQILDPFSSVLNDYHLYYPGENTSLRFYGNGENDIDRVKIPIDDPPRPVDLGSTDFTLEWWMKANPGENNAGSCTPGSQNWESGNHIFDRSVFEEDGSGELGVSLADGRIAVGVNNGTESDTLCGITDIADGIWHHVVITRGLDGSMRIFIDGTSDADTTGPLGDISYPDSRTETHQNDPFLVIGAEKFDIDPLLYPSFSGWIDEIHFSNTIRYLADFTPSTDPTSPDGNSVGLYHFDEGMGDFINDTSGAWGGPSNSTRSFGGDPAGPEWSFETPTWIQIFQDVPYEYWAREWIEILYAKGITSGCNTYPLLYCPRSAVTRAQMAVFIERGMRGPGFSPPADSGTFDDVPPDHWASNWIEQLFLDGLTSGCSVDPFRYCPENTVTRAEMAVFLERAMAWPNSPVIPPATGLVFNDVPIDFWASAWIEKLAADGITSGCSTDPPLYCPYDSVTRAQMAVFLVRAFDLSMP